MDNYASWRLSRRVVVQYESVLQKIAARTKPRFIEIKPERRRGTYHTPAEASALRRAEEEYRWWLVRTFLED